MRDPLPYRFVRLLVLVLCAVAYPAAAQQVVYVDVNATGPGQDGATWCTAYRDLQDALVAASPGDAIRVAEGIYRPDRGTGDRTAAFQLIDAVGLYGGFAGCGAPNPDARDISLNETVLSGDLRGDDVLLVNDPDCANGGGTWYGVLCDKIGNNEENAYHVVVSTNNDDTAILDGFIVSGGNANGPGLGPTPASQDQGSGVNIYFGRPTLRNCLIQHNRADNHGAVNDHGGATILNCEIRENFSTRWGGGLHNHVNIMTSATDCRFYDNATAGTSGGGGGMFVKGNPTMTNCIFSGNVSATKGGAMYNDRAAGPTIIDCTFVENTAVQGGAIYNINASANLTNCSITGNTASESGGGMYSINESHGNFTDCTWRANTAQSGGAIYLKFFSNPTLKGCTIIENQAIAPDTGAGFDGGGGIWMQSGTSPVIDRTDFIHNTAVTGGGAIYSSFTTSAGRTGGAKYTNCRFIGNTADYGGVIANYRDNVLFTNCTFSGNFASGTSWRGGGGVIHNYQDGGTTGLVGTTLVHCTLSGNSSDADGGAAFLYYGHSILTLTGSIFWENAHFGGIIEEAGQIYVRLGAANVTVHHTLLQGWTGTWGGIGNFGDDPLFVGASGDDNIVGTVDDDLRLRAGSPCVDAGDNSSLPQDTTDLDGDGDTSEPLPVDLADNPRIVGASVDMGAYERGHLDCNGNGINDTTDILAGTSQDCDGNGVPDECDSDCNSNGVADACEPDRDGDGSIDDCDLCPDDGSKTAPGLCGCGVSDVDSDDDTVPDCNDVCPGADDLLDTDGDGVADGCDSCNGADDTLDCNHNGYSDPCEVLDGVAPDLDGNGVPDECDIMPHTAGEGCRALGVTPAPTGEPLALRLTSQDFPCLDQFLAADGGLTDSPVFLTSDEWGLVIVANEQIIPSTRYAVTAELAGGAVSAQSWITTPPWGDVVGNGPGALPDGNVNFSDIGAVVDCFKQVLTAPPLHRCDIWPAAPDGNVNFSDIGASVEGFKSIPYPYAGPCP